MHAKTGSATRLTNYIFRKSFQHPPQHIKLAKYAYGRKITLISVPFRPRNKQLRSRASWNPSGRKSAAEISGTGHRGFGNPWWMRPMGPQKAGIWLDWEKNSPVLNRWELRDTLRKRKILLEKEWAFFPLTYWNVFLYLGWLKSILIGFKPEKYWSSIPSLSFESLKLKIFKNRPLSLQKSPSQKPIN